MINVKTKTCIDCDKVASFNLIGGKPLYCKEHKLDNMVNIRTTTYEKQEDNIVVVKNLYYKCLLCDKTPVFNYVNEKKGIYCNEHKLENMVDVQSKKCLKCNKHANYNFKGEYAIYCNEHKLENMINVKTKTCIDCDKVPSFNLIGNKPLYCNEHKLENMVDVRNTKYQNQEDNIIVIKSKRKIKKCLLCDKIPVFNYENKKNGIYCNEHKLENMVDVISKKCLKCNKHAIYNFKGEYAIYCNEHKLENMINVKIKTCIDCDKVPSFNLIGNKALYCNKHKLVNMVDVRKKNCIKCTKTALYGLIKNTHCIDHKTSEMLKNPSKKCIKCNEKAIYGYNKSSPLYCEKHKDNDCVNLIERVCVSCSLLNILNENNLCIYCDPQKQKIKKRKENIIKDLLDSNNIKYNLHNQIIDYNCGKERPDFVIDHITHIVILEVDENQHNSYSCECEQTRMINITQTLGGTPVIWIRYNPDSFTINNNKMLVSDTIRHKILLEYLTKFTIKQPDNLSEVIYLYYDDWTPDRHLLIKYE
jgi:hypothetical protein